MTDITEVLTKLKLTPKGKLTYDRDMHGENGIEKVLIEVSSPPQVSRSPKTEKIEEEEEKADAPIKNEVLSPKSPAHPRVELSTKSMAAEKQLRQADKEIRIKAKADYLNECRRSERHEELVMADAHSQLYQLYFDLDNKAQEQFTRMKQLQLAGVEADKTKASKLKEDHSRRARLLDERMQEAHRQQREEENKLKILHQEEQQQRLNKMMDCAARLKSIHEKCQQHLASCTHPQLLTESSKKAVDNCQKIHDRLAREVAQHQGGVEVTGNHLKDASLLEEEAAKFLAIFSRDIAEANRKGKEGDAAQQAHHAQQVEQQKKDAVAAASASAAAAQATAAAAQAPAPSGGSSTGSAGGDRSIMESGLVTYHRVRQALGKTLKEFEILVNDPQFKKVKLQLYKPIVTNINKISATDMSILREKANSLITVLSGGTTNNQAALAFCRELLAKRIVKQGDDQISSNHESAFGVAYVVVQVMKKFPEVTDLLLAHFYMKCPYLVPYYLPKREGQTEEEYYKTLGYNYTDGEREKQDKFLIRMSGLARLYTAILITPGSPHSLDQGWTWLVSILSLGPRPQITALLLFDILEVAGNALMAAYGKQFVKLLRTLQTVFMPRIVQVSQGLGGGMDAKLKEFVDKALQTGQIQPPNGMLRL